MKSCEDCSHEDCKNIGGTWYRLECPECGVNWKEDNMWNYVSEGKLPERQEMGVSDHVIVAVEGCPYGQSGYYDFDLQAWFVDGCSEPVKVEAWQKIELPKIEKAEKKYRPFKDTDELIKVWQRKCGNVAVRLHKLDAPYIWVRYKAHPENNYLITGLFWENDEVFIGQYSYKLSEFFRDWEFLDGTPCGVEE